MWYTIRRWSANDSRFDTIHMIIIQMSYGLTCLIDLLGSISYGDVGETVWGFSSLMYISSTGLCEINNSINLTMWLVALE